MDSCLERSSRSYSVVRQGTERLDDVLAVVIEFNGKIGVIKKSDTPSGKSSLEDLDIPNGQGGAICRIFAFIYLKLLN